MGFENIGEYDGSEVRAPLPVKRDVLYDTPMLYGYVTLLFLLFGFFFLLLLFCWRGMQFHHISKISTSRST